MHLLIYMFFLLFTGPFFLSCSGGQTQLIDSTVRTVKLNESADYDISRADCNEQSLEAAGLSVVSTFPLACDHYDYWGQDLCDSRAEAAGMGDLNVEYYREDTDENTVCGCRCSVSLCGTDPNPDTATRYDAFGNGDDIPFRIYAGAQFYSMSRNIDALYANYELCQDVDLDLFYGTTSDSFYFSIGSEWRPFTGDFEGNYYHVYNFKYIADHTDPNYSDPTIVPVRDLSSPSIILRNMETNIGLFGRAELVQIQNLHLNDVTIDIAKAHYVGGLVGHANESKLKTISTSGLINSGVNKFGAGGIVGTYSGSAERLWSSAKVVGDGYEHGGLMGHMYGGSLKRSHATGDVSSNGLYTGGLLGGSSGNCKVIDSYAMGDVRGYEYTGGLIGSVSGCQVTDSFATGNVRADKYVGGLAGYFGNSKATRTHAVGSVTGDLDTGGLIGFAVTGKVEQSYATGAVSGAKITGGLIASMIEGTTLKQSYATGDVSGNEDVGGLVGHLWNSSSIDRSYATGTVLGKTLVGGLVSSIWYSSVEQSYASGNVMGVDAVGGFAGASWFSSVSQSHATGKVSGSNYVAGFVSSLQEGSLKDVYAAGDVTGLSVVGGLAGTIFGDVVIEGGFVRQEKIEGQTDVNLVIGQSNFSNTQNIVHYWSPVQCLGSPCSANASEVGHNDPSYFFRQADLPLNQWNFVNVWNINEGQGLPYLDL